MTAQDALAEAIQRVTVLQRLPEWVLRFVTKCLVSGWPAIDQPRQNAEAKLGVDVPKDLHDEGESLRLTYVPTMSSQNFWTFVWAIGDTFITVAEQPEGLAVKDWAPSIAKILQEQVEYWTSKTTEFAPTSGLLRIETPDGPMGMASPVLKKLLAKGIVIQDTDGVFSAPSKAIVDQFVDDFGMCDFCSSGEPKHTILVPDFEMYPNHGMSTGGWMACDTCYTAIRENRRKDVLRRAIDSVKGGKFSAAAIKGLHDRFWTAYDAMIDAAGIGTALNEFIDDKLPTKTPFKGRDKRLEAVRRMTGLTDDEMDALQHGDTSYKEVTKKLAAWKKQMGADKYADARTLADMLGITRPTMQPGVIPHWQVALDSKFAALKIIQAPLQDANNVILFDNSTDLNNPQETSRVLQQAQVIQRMRNMGMYEDARQLRLAETYSFNSETMHAIIAGSQSIPHESPLSSVEIPKITSGWYWFAEPFPVPSSPVSSDTTAALLWGWAKQDGEDAEIPTMRFSAWVYGDKNSSEYKGKLLPSTKWYWPLHMTLHEMIGYNTQHYRQTYGPGGPQEHESGVIGEEATMRSLTELSLFFMMSCVWFKGRVLVEAPGHIERHARKRLVKEHKLPDIPTVRVVALRKALRDAVDRPEGQTDGTGHKLSVRFVVDGHPRLQPCGPGGKDRKLIWIDPFVKGSPDLPFKHKGQRVFAVVR